MNRSTNLSKHVARATSLRNEVAWVVREGKQTWADGMRGGSGWVASSPEPERIESCSLPQVKLLRFLTHRAMDALFPKHAVLEAKLPKHAETDTEHVKTSLRNRAFSGRLGPFSGRLGPFSGRLRPKTELLQPQPPPGRAAHALLPKQPAIDTGYVKTPRDGCFVSKTRRVRSRPS